MKTEDDANVCPGTDLICPGCHRPLKLPRIGRGDGKPLVCGGCGQRFDCGDLSSPSPEPDRPA
jgi:hypothetical protein